jgi:hypothetical protein
MIFECLADRLPESIIAPGFVQKFEDSALKKDQRLRH